MTLAICFVQAVGNIVFLQLSGKIDINVLRILQVKLEMNIIDSQKKIQPKKGIEPLTYTLRGCRSTN